MSHDLKIFSIWGDIGVVTLHLEMNVFGEIRFVFHLEISAYYGHLCNNAFAFKFFFTSIQCILFSLFLFLSIITFHAQNVKNTHFVK